MAVYTGDLTDVGVNSLAGFQPQLTVRPERDAWGPNGAVSDHPMDVTLSGSSFSMELIPSTQLTNEKGVGGIGYILEVALLGGALGFKSEWRFNALPGGGSIADMIGVPADPGPPYWELISQAELDARVAGLVDELDLATIRKCVHSEDGAWVWSAPEGVTPTDYVIPDHEGKHVVRPAPFPIPDATPAFTW